MTGRFSPSGAVRIGAGSAQQSEAIFGDASAGTEEGVRLVKRMGGDMQKCQREQRQQ